MITAYKISPNIYDALHKAWHKDSLPYYSKYSSLFRYSSFVLATVILRLSRSVPKYINVIFALTAGVFVFVSTYLYNYLNINKLTLAEK